MNSLSFNGLSTILLLQQLLLLTLFALMAWKTVHSIEIHENKSRYDHHRIYYVHLDTKEQVDIFQQLEKNSDSCIFLGHARRTGQKLSLLVAGHKIGDFTNLLERFNVSHEILLYNFQDIIDEEWKTVKEKNTTGNQMDWKHYFYIDTIYEWLNNTINQYPNYLSELNLGYSYNGYPIRGIRLSKQKGNTGIFIESGIHAREWITPAVTTFILNELLTSNDTNVMDISMNFDWYIFPIINPDGYMYTFERDRMWRKSRKPYGLCVGADLNRNFDAHWNSIGSSADPCDYDFAGSYVNSETESSLLTTFLNENTNKFKIKTFLSLHSYSQLVMFPYGYGPEKVPNYNDLSVISKKAVAAIEKRYGRKYVAGSIYETIYPSSGGSKDWAYSVAQIPITFTFELRGPSYSSNLFILPANEIIETGYETLDAFYVILQEAKHLGYYD